MDEPRAVFCRVRRAEARQFAGGDEAAGPHGLVQTLDHGLVAQLVRARA